MSETMVQMILEDMRRERRETRKKIFALIREAVKADDWDTVRKFGHYSADIAAAILRVFSDRLSPKYKREIALFHFTDKGDSYPIIRRTVIESLNCRPENWRDNLPEPVRELDTFTVYRAGVEPIENAQFSMSWTLSRDVAEWFAKRQEHYGWGESHLYRGIISAEKIIAYLNDRREFEIVQYGNVCQIEEITRRGPSEEFLSLRSMEDRYNQEAIDRQNRMFEDYINKSLALEKVS